MKPVASSVYKEQEGIPSRRVKYKGKRGVGVKGKQGTIFVSE